MKACSARNYGVMLQCLCGSLTVVYCLLWRDAVESGRYRDLREDLAASVVRADGNHERNE